MRLTAIILLSACLTASATGKAQGISLSEHNASLEQVFKKIEQQSGYSFIYRNEWLKEASKVTIAIKNASLEQVLNLCFDKQPFTYAIVDKMIVIKQKEESSKKAGATNASVTLSGVEAPLIDISGKVTDTDGNPLSGASVKVKGTSNGTTTHTDGTFVLRGIDQNATLEISFVGYEPYTIAVNNRSSITASLKLNIVSNPEVIINKGYYTEKQKTSVSNVGKVTGDVIAKQPVDNVLLALQARVPGLFITQPSGIPGSGINVRIQGQNSLANGNEPLYVIDGVPVEGQLQRTWIDYPLATGGGQFSGFGNPLSYLNPMDIESVEVLKDADATAIYGSRAANGAILITTKKGKAGAMKFDLDMQTGWGKMTRRLDMMNTRQYLDMRYEAFANDGINWRDASVSANDLKVWDTTHYTNWQDELLGGTARYNNVNASISGGSPNMRYLVSGTYNKQTTIFPFPDFADQKAAVHFNLNANNNNQKLRMQFSGNYMFDDNELPNADITQTALLLEPDAPPLLNSDGSINWAPDANGNTTLGDANVMVQQYKRYVNKTYNLLSSLKLDYTLPSGLNLSINFGYNYMQTNDYLTYPLIAITPELRATSQRSASFGDRNIQSWIIEPQVSYAKNISNGKLDLLIGSTFQDKKTISNSLTGIGQLSDAFLDDINAAAIITKGTATSSNYRYNALFGRANYNWSDKYILSVNARRDGSTRFGEDNRFQNFGSVGTAWIFSNERFFKSCVDLINFGKLRGSYGTTGSDQIGDYQFMSLYNLYSNAPVPYQGLIGLVPTGLPNPDLQWEETRKLQLGIDLGFLQDKFVLNASWVRNRSSNQLLPYALPNQAGFPSYLVNFPATIQNRNWEFSATFKIFEKKKLNWIAIANLTVPKNNLLDFPGLANSTYSGQLVIGQPVDVWTYYHWSGVAPGTGDYLYTNKTGHLTIAPNFPEDQTVMISRFPKFYGGFENTVSYKRFEFDFIFQFVKQIGYNDIAFWNGSRYPGAFARGNSNQPLSVLNPWQMIGDKVSVGRYSTYDLSTNLLNSDRRFADASYLRLKNVALSWELPQKWVSKVHFRSFSVYLHAQNLLTITKYEGLDPEVQILSSLPPLQVWTVGAQIGL